MTRAHKFCAPFRIEIRIWIIGHVTILSCEFSDLAHRLKEYRKLDNATPGLDWWGWKFWLGASYRSLFAHYFILENGTRKRKVFIHRETKTAKEAGKIKRIIYCLRT